MPTIFAGARVFDGVRFLPQPLDVLLRDGRIESIGTFDDTGADRIVGGVLFPGFVDAHVHLSFCDALDVAGGGVTTVLDLGEPEAYAFEPHLPLTFRFAGPIFTAPRGYPSRSWGSEGYACEVNDVAEARDAVASLADRGATVIKLAIEPAGGPLLDGEIMSEIVDEAHRRSLMVAAHALGAATVATALDAGADILAHTPVEPLPAALVKAVASRGVAVISTIRAFGAAASTRRNLEALVAAGCTIVYGTDLGNDGIAPGIDAAEIEILADVLGSEEKALASATSVAGAYARHGGRIEPGGPADVVWMERYESPADLAGVKHVWKNGTRLTPR